MKKLTLSLLMVCVFVSSVFAQYEIKIHAIVIDSQSKEPIPYANVGFVNQSIGTVTNKKGRFYLRYDEDEIRKNNVFQISSNGYETLKLNQKQVFDMLRGNNKISLKRIENFPEDLSFITSSNDAFNKTKSTLGYAAYSSKLLAYWKSRKNLGGEIATLVKVNKPNSKLLNLKFDVIENLSDSLLVRIHIYDKNRKGVGNDLTQGNIYHTIDKKAGEEIIDLSKYNIKVDTDFIVGIELVQIYGDDVQFTVKVAKGGNSFLKNTSQAPWKEHKDASIAFKIDTEYQESLDTGITGNKEEHVILYWDTSLSMLDRDLEKDLSLINNYFSRIKQANIELITFSDILRKQQNFNIKDGDCSELLNVLRNSTYNGASNFSKLFGEKKQPDKYLVFTDGVDTYGSKQFLHGKPVFYINSKGFKHNRRFLNEGVSNNGGYIDLSKNTVDNAISVMINGTYSDSFIRYDEEEGDIVYGKVISQNTPVQGCKVAVKGTLIETTTDAEGKFSIPVKMNQVLSLRHFSTTNKEVVVRDKNNLMIDLKQKYVNLNEVSLSEINQKETKERVNLGNRKIEKSKLGFASYTLKNENFAPAAIHFTDLLRSRFPGVRVVGFGDNSSVVVRGRSSISLGNSPAYVVDGVLQGFPPYYLVPAQIESITLIPGLSGAVRYGTAARNGVFIIETKLAAASASDEEKNQALVKGNDYTGSTYVLNPNTNRPQYLDALFESVDYQEAVATYYELRADHINEVPFYVYTSEYFMMWNKGFSKEIISNLAEIADTNHSALRTLAFVLEERGETEQAKVVYENLFNLEPDFAQSMLDLARIYKENKEFTKSYDMYTRIMSNEGEGIEFLEVYKQAESELRHLINHHKYALVGEEIPAEFLSVKGAPVRIVFDWNDPHAEFEFQFVNPKKKYENWVHRFENNKELLSKEVEHGILSKEFIVDESMKGEWIINVRSLGESSEYNPPFMKYTIYNNYGLPNETKSVKFIKLYSQKDKVTLDKFSI